ncbi:RNA methyltransferase [Geobacter sp. DSM 9736]|uniref:RNA methyltransferase n=1 Tax=Geobacter sp. DSM 9736 TaxID=1277350 RepID=UPI000B50C176|nr:RNA methyltransferase [Geobacter sp. DSM 9736]SNB45796.1 tRNA/rRNA methyltransferase [Geobacter sp. DSM 9736]
MQNQSSVAVVLVEPQSPGNIGMVCRAMKNMGLRELLLVNPCPVQHPDAYRFAVSARDVLDSARIFGSLAEALSDRHISIATTRRHGKYRRDIMSPVEVAARLNAQIDINRAAFVFGREDSGLTTEEVAQCTWQATIPTDDEYGSLNLAQAVLIFSYEFFKARSSKGEKSGRQLAAAGDFESLYSHMEQTLLRIGFLNPQNPDHLMRTFRRILARSEMDSRDVAIFRGMMTQIDWATNEYKGKKR